MQIPILCMTCSHDQEAPSFESHQAVLRNDGLYYLECPRGHKTVSCLQEQKFEVLFDVGVNALIDCYYREAISSFATSLERFHEFCIAVICNNKKVSQEVFSKAWKNVANQSERQFGAYIFVYMTQFGEMPPLLKNKSVDFRNAVIHKGKIPSYEEAVNFGEEVLTLVHPVLRRLKTNLSESIGLIVMQHVKNTREKIKGDRKVQFLGIPTTISVALAQTEADATFEQAIQRYKTQRERRHSK
ncbi:MAG: hypothetical protein ACHQYP_10775 [Nitrospiria bacterium]